MYVATGKFPSELGRMIAKLQQLRDKSDSDEKYYSEPTKINVSGVQDISACDRGAAVLKKNGSLWMWGGAKNRKTV